MKTTNTYTTIDGKIFDNREAAQKHEKELNKQLNDISELAPKDLTY